MGSPRSERLVRRMLPLAHNSDSEIDDGNGLPWSSSRLVVVVVFGDRNCGLKSMKR